ncbi:MAG: prepilin-type N-terminal cleavage/methylation domain-containing protein [Eubacteriales bacterium]
MHIFSNIKYTKTGKYSFYHKRGFTLVETVIAIGMLLVIVIIIYQGFLSTIQLSTNTANFQKAGDLAAGSVNRKIATASITSPTPALQAIHLGSPSFNKNLGVFAFKATPSPNTNYGDEKYREVSPTPSTTSRSGFWYSGAPLS